MNSPGVMMRYNPQMDGMYELVFRGEVLDGQHRAVVKRRLRELLNLSESQADNLFADKRVVIKSSADESTAKNIRLCSKRPMAGCVCCQPKLRV